MRREGVSTYRKPLPLGEVAPLGDGEGNPQRMLGVNFALSVAHATALPKGEPWRPICSVWILYAGDQWSPLRCCRISVVDSEYSRNTSPLSIIKNIGHITVDFSQMMCPTFYSVQITLRAGALFACRRLPAYLQASSIATATATVIPTMGLLPAPIRPIIST